MTVRHPTAARHAASRHLGRRRYVAVVPVLALVALVVVPLWAAARETTTTLVVTSTAWGGADAAPGDGKCETVGGVCTLRAAIEESNALNRPAGEVLITVSETIPLNTRMTSAPGSWDNDPRYFMSTSSVVGRDVAGVQFVVSAPVIIDFGHRLRPNAGVTDVSENTLFYLNSPDVQILNCDDPLSSGSSFAVGPLGNRVTIDGDTMGLNGGFASIVTPTYAPERFVVLNQGAQNVTVRNYTIKGFYNNNAQSAIFLFNNPVAATPTSPTRDVLVENVQLNYPSNGICNGVDGSGCRAPIVSFWTARSLGGAAGSYNSLIDGLTFQDMVVTNQKTGLFGFQLAAPGGVTTSGSADITNLTIKDSTFTRSGTYNNADPFSAFITLPHLTRLHGTTKITDNVFTAPQTADQSGQGTAIVVVGDQPSGSTVPSNVTIADNYFNGFGTHSTIRLQGAGLVTVVGNTFGTATDSSGLVGATTTESGEETSQDYVMVSNAVNVAPFRSTNQGIVPWYPARGTIAAVLTGAAPAGTQVVSDARDGEVPTCTVLVEVTRPTSASGNNAVPADPVTLQAYWTSGQTAEVYLGQVTGVTGPDARLAVPLPVGTLPLPDGASATVVDPTSGSTGGRLRFQTQVEGLGQLESSQYSRTVPIGGVCHPVLTIDQAAGMVDPTYGRDLHFTLRSSMPLDPGTLTADDIHLTATPTTQTIDAARLDPRVVSITPVAHSGGTTFDVVARVDDSAQVTVSVPAGAVTSLAGLTNPYPASSTDDSITFVNPLRATPAQLSVVVDGTPRTFTVGRQNGSPVPSSDLRFAATVTPAPTGPRVTLSTTAPVLSAGGSATSPVTVTVDGYVPQGALALITMTVTSADTSYDGLVVPTVTAHLFAEDPAVQIAKRAWVDVADPSSPERIEATGTLAPSGSRLSDGQPVCFVYTVTNLTADPLATSLTDVVVTDTDTRLGTDGVIGTVPVLGPRQSVKLSACTTLIPVDTTAGGGR